MFNFDVALTAEELESFIHDVCRKEKSEDVLLAVSGGVDSAVSLALTVNAIGKEHVYPIFLPYDVLNEEGTQDAKEVVSAFGIDEKQIMTINIKPFVDAVAIYDQTMDDGRLGNIMARMRMILLYDLSKKLNRLVVGTENKTEHFLGYYTRFGDEASDIEPLRDLYKTQVFELAEYLGVPEKTITKPPSAGLWIGQTDEGEFGFPYKVADEILYLHYEEKLPKEKIIAKGYEKEIIEKVWWWIEKGELKARLPHKPSK